MRALLVFTITFLAIGARADLLVPPTEPFVKSGAGKVEFSKNIKDQDATIRVIEANLRNLKTCYSRALKKNTQIEGTVLVKWEVAPNGKTKSAGFEEDLIKNWGMKKCLMRNFKTWIFPETSDGKVGTFLYSFEFRVREPAPPES